MGKKRVIAQTGTTVASAGNRAGRRAKRSNRPKLMSGRLHIQATYNNTKLAFHDNEGNLICGASSGALGFSGAKKGTTFAAGKVGEHLAEQVLDMGVKDVDVVIKGVGAGREAALRAFSAKNINITSIKDATPIPFNGPKLRKPRRV